MFVGMLEGIWVKFWLWQLHMSWDSEHAAEARGTEDRRIPSIIMLIMLIMLIILVKGKLEPEKWRKRKKE